MDFAYRFGDPNTIYLNVTNRCTNRCSFCVRYATAGLGGAVLRGNEQPDMPALQKAVEDCGAFEEIREFVWCGFGEPTFRLDLIQQAAPWLRRHGARVRLNTNGHACLIHGRDVLPDLANAVDSISVSLNAPESGRYLQLCRPESNPSTPPIRFWDAMLEFLARTPEFFRDTQASVVGFALSIEEIEKCRSLAGSLGIGQFRIR